VTCADKSRFTSRDKARHAARVVSSEGGDQLRFYACSECGGYHLSTSIWDVTIPPGWNGQRRRGRRLAPGQSLEELAAEIRAGRG
jgi:hypothetical protein